jgi:XRE family transcriptional regulator, fatty acid utilization regulator
MKTQAQDQRIRLRLKAFREERGLTQEDLAARLGFEHRQTLAAIESGERRLTPAELVRAAEALGVELDAFTDPFRLVGEGSFSFRAKGVDAGTLAAFEQQAGRWLATYRELSTALGERPALLGAKLELSGRSSFEEAMAAGEGLWERWELGEVPADRLEEAITRELGTLVLYVDAPAGISGAASRLPSYDAILVNRRESSGRRYFDLAHELFHVLTWDAMPPARVEDWDVSRRKGNRVEHLADNFAGALLMPSAVLVPRWLGRGEEDLAAWMTRTAGELRVSGDALRWRLVALDLLSRAEARALDLRAGSGGAGGRGALLFSERFVDLVSRGVNAGRLSVRRAAGLLGLRVGQLARLCRDHGHPLAYDLAE